MLKEQLEIKFSAYSELYDMLIPADDMLRLINNWSWDCAGDDVDIREVSKIVLYIDGSTAAVAPKQLAIKKRMDFSAGSVHIVSTTSRKNLKP